MKQLALTHFTDTHLTLMGLFLFLFVFLGMSFLTFHRSRKKLFQEIQNLPFEESLDGGRTNE